MYKSRDRQRDVSLREAMINGGQSNRIPNYEPEIQNRYLVDAFWKLKCGDIDYKIRNDDFKHVLLDRNDRDIIRSMDMAFMGEVNKHRSAAAQEKAKPKNGR